MRISARRARKFVSLMIAMFAAAWLSADGRLAAQCSGTTITSMSPSVVSQIWTACGSPYHITASINVADLEIQEGVTVMCDPGVAITVTTWMRAIGTAQNPITFTASTSNGNWNGLKFINSAVNVNGAGGSLLSYVVVEKSIQSGIYISECNPEITDCSIIQNQSTGVSGGGIRIFVTSPIDVIMRNVNVFDNEVKNADGGGLFASVSQGNLIIEDCIFEANQVRPVAGSARQNRGGGAALLGRSNVVRSIFRGNVCEGSAVDLECAYDALLAAGGGVWLSGSHSFANCIITENDATVALPGYVNSGNNCGCCCSNCYTGWESRAQGGGIYYDGTVTTTLSNCLIAGNLLSTIDSSNGFASSSVASSVGRQGSGVFCAGSSLQIVNCTVVRNDKEGIAQSSGQVVVLNSIIYFNNQTGLNPAQYSSQIGSGSTIVVNSCVQGGFSFSIGLISVDPSLAGTGTDLNSNTITAASPCIDAGHADAVYNDAQSCGSPPYGTPRNDIGCHGGPLGCSWTIGGVLSTTPTYPGTSEDLLLRSSVDGTLTAFPDVKAAAAGQILQINLSTPNATFAAGIPLLVAQFLAQNQQAGSVGAFPYLHFDLLQPVYILFDGLLGSPLGPMPIIPGGLTLTYQIPPGLSGSSFMVQGLALNAGAANGIFAASDAHEIEFL